MNWCKIIGHKWEYGTQEIDVLNNIHSIRKNRNTPTRVDVIYVRLCERCFKKQKTKLGVGVYNFKLGKYCNWKEMELTKSEKREKKYKELGL
jgi:hypothetical protein